MSKPSGFMLKFQQEKEIYGMAVRQHTRQQFLDFATIALGRMGYGPKRLKDFEKNLTDVYLDYSKLFKEDENSKDPDYVYTRAKMDEELARCCGPYFEPYEKRYFEE